jgi:hypothetical protein
MKNKYEGYCRVCGEVVAEGKGLAETIKRQPGMAGFGATVWAVRHNNCMAPTAESIERKQVARDSAEHDAGSEGQQVEAAPNTN